MEIGNYVNVFPVKFGATRFRVVETKREEYPSLKELRARLRSSSICAVENKLYGFGRDLRELIALGFTELEVAVQDIPRLTTAIIKDGISRHAIDLGYVLEYGFANRVFDRKNPLPTLTEEVQLFKGFEFRPLYLFDRLGKSLFFGIIVDLRHKLELEGKSASYAQINQYVTNKYGEELAHQVIMDIRFRSGDLNPFGQRNPEASRFRLGNILDFVSKFGNVVLYDKSNMYLSQEPIRIIGEE